MSEPPNFILSALPAKAAKEILPEFSARGSIVIDKSDAFRMQEEPAIKLIVPEVNGHLLIGDERIVASPNCTTTQLVVAINPLHKELRLSSLHVTTFQSASGAGKEGSEQLRKESLRIPVPKTEMVFRPQLFRNVVPVCGSITGSGESTEELKIKMETRKIMELPDLPVYATSTRVAVERSHSMSVVARFEKPTTAASVMEILSREGTGVEIPCDNSEYFTALEASGENLVYVSRIRVDKDDPRIVSLWVVADNLRKGAALNAWQIMKIIMNRKGWS
ncbi:MAG: aspartate-semialdehyde dehydrogenase [Candidatus Paceibacterota bacterium]